MRNLWEEKMAHTPIEYKGKIIPPQKPQALPHKFRSREGKNIFIQ